MPGTTLICRTCGMKKNTLGLVFAPITDEEEEVARFKAHRESKRAVRYADCGFFAGCSRKNRASSTIQANTEIRNSLSISSVISHPLVIFALIIGIIILHVLERT